MAKFECQKYNAQPSSNVRKTMHGMTKFKCPKTKAQSTSNVRKLMHGQVRMSEKLHIPINFARLGCTLGLFLRCYFANVDALVPRVAGQRAAVDEADDTCVRLVVADAAVDFVTTPDLIKGGGGVSISWFGVAFWPWAWDLYSGYTRRQWCGKHGVWGACGVGGGVLRVRRTIIWPALMVSMRTGPTFAQVPSKKATLVLSCKASSNVIGMSRLSVFSASPSLTGKSMCAGCAGGVQGNGGIRAKAMP